MNGDEAGPGPETAPLCGVVVLYQPEPGADENLRAMVRECGRLFVMDNGSSPEFRATLAGTPGIELQDMGGNAGLGAALNRGLDRACAQGMKWAVTFDQDSRPAAGMVQALRRTARALPRAAVICPRISDRGDPKNGYRWVVRHPVVPGLFRRVPCDRADLPEVTMAVTSGSLLELCTWEKLGRFVEGFFIDYIDIEYCLRVQRAGRTIAVAHAALLHHRLGARTEQVVLGRDLRPMNHAPFRHFYMARNRVATWRRHALAVPHWAAFDFCFAWYNLARVLLFERQRWAKVKAVVRGTWHGLLGRGGPMP